jgi:hypothetical protein
MNTTEIPNAERSLHYKYAEEWLDHAVSALRSYFAQFGHLVPIVEVSCGHGIDGYSPKRKVNTDGICLSKRYSKAHINQIYISPKYTEPLDVLNILAHELIHAVDDCFSMHGPTFKEIALDLGMTDSGDLFYDGNDKILEIFSRIALPLGRYPRAGITYEESFQLCNPDYQHQRILEKYRSEERRRKLKSSRS